MLYDDWMEESIDQLLRSIGDTKDVVDCIPSPQSVEEKGIPFHTTPLHDHYNSFLNQNSSETMFSNVNETLCGSSIIPTMVMLRSHSSTSHLQSNIRHGDHATLSSSTHNGISLRDGKDPSDKGEIIPSP